MSWFARTSPVAQRGLAGLACDSGVLALTDMAAAAAYLLISIPQPQSVFTLQQSQAKVMTHCQKNIQRVQPLSATYFTSFDSSGQK